VTELPLVEPLRVECWNRVGVRGDRSCPELPKVGHCHNCPVFADAGRQFLNISSPEGYLEEWTERLAAPLQEALADLLSVLVFRLGEEWLALPVRALVEVGMPRPVHRVPHRGGALAGLVNVRGELHLCARLGHLLGIDASEAGEAPRSARLLVVRRDGEAWAFLVDEVDQVHRVPAGELTAVPATVARAAARLTAGVFTLGGRAVGCLDEARLFEALRARVR
jgi:chemotaxis-related protein WspD